MGRSSTGTPGHKPAHIFRDTRPCRVLTPLVAPERRMARTAMENGSWGSAGFCRPSARNSSRESPSCVQYEAKYRSIRSGANTSMPAGTGVWVVKILLAVTASRASVKLTLCRSTRRRMRSRARNAGCPSLMWHTVGSMPSIARARIPPTPRRISCRRRMSRSPPYRYSVMPRSSAALVFRSVSSRYRGTRPTWARQTCARSFRPGNSTSTVTGSPSGRRSSVSGRVE